MASWVQDRRGVVARGKSVERVFHHVVAGDADGMHQQLAGEFRQVEAGAHLAAVDGEAAGAGGQLLLPGRQRGAVGGVEAQPETHRPGAVAGPVVGGDQPRGQAVLVSEENEVGGEVQPVQVAACGWSATQVGQADLVERQGAGAGG